MIEDAEPTKLKRVTSTKTAMEGKVTMTGGLFLSDLKGADSVFALENRYAAYAADRRKVIKKKKKPDDLSKSMHDEPNSNPNSFHIKTEAAPLGTSSSHGFFDYHFNKDGSTKSKGDNSKGPTPAPPRRGRKRTELLRAKRLDSDDAEALVAAMQQLKKYQNNKDSDDSSSSDSDDSSFTSDLCHYHKDMKAKTNIIKNEAVKGFTMVNDDAASNAVKARSKTMSSSSNDKNKEEDDDDGSTPTVPDLRRVRSSGSDHGTTKSKASSVVPPPRRGRRTQSLRSDQIKKRMDV
jgi:hypothetical protein